jgi:hypothetical protein
MFNWLNKKMYHKFQVDLTDGQRKKLMSAVEKSSPLTLKFKHEQLGKGTELLFTQRQINKLAKAMSEGMGAQIKFSQAVVRKMKSGGILPVLAALAPLGIALLSGALSTASAYGTSKAIKAIEKGAEKKKGRGSRRGRGRGGKLYQLGGNSSGGCMACGAPCGYARGYGDSSGGKLYQLGTTGRRGRGASGGKLFPLGVKDRR